MDARDQERLERLAQHQKEREVGFANEAFAITVLQVVSGGAVALLLSQAETVIGLVRGVGFAILLSLASLAVVAAVLAAYWKHLYKMWDIKARVSAEKAKTLVELSAAFREAEDRSQKAERYLWWMRHAMTVSACLLCLGGAAMLAL